MIRLLFIIRRRRDDEAPDEVREVFRYAVQRFREHIELLGVVHVVPGERLDLLDGGAHVVGAPGLLFRLGKDILGHGAQVFQGRLDLLGAHSLLFRFPGDDVDFPDDVVDVVRYVAQELFDVVDAADALADVAAGLDDEALDELHLVGGAHCQPGDLVGHHGEAASVLAGPGGLDGRVERQHARLIGDLVDNGGDSPYLFGAGLDLLHLGHHVAQPLVAFAEARRQGFPLLADPLDAPAHVLRGNGELLDGGVYLGRRGRGGLDVVLDVVRRLGELAYPGHGLFQCVALGPHALADALGDDVEEPGVLVELADGVAEARDDALQVDDGDEHFIDYVPDLVLGVDDEPVCEVAPGDFPEAVDRVGQGPHGVGRRQVYRRDGKECGRGEDEEQAEDEAPGQGGSVGARGAAGQEGRYLLERVHADEQDGQDDEGDEHDHQPPPDGDGDDLFVQDELARYELHGEVELAYEAGEDALGQEVGYHPRDETAVDDLDDGEGQLGVGPGRRKEHRHHDEDLHGADAEPGEHEHAVKHGDVVRPDVGPGEELVVDLLFFIGLEKLRDGMEQDFVGGDGERGGDEDHPPGEIEHDHAALFRVEANEVGHVDRHEPGSQARAYEFREKEPEFHVPFEERFLCAPG